MKGLVKAFRKGITLIELFQMFPDDASAERWLEEARWGEAGKPAYCPHCGCDDKLRPVPSRRPLPYWCGSCRRNYSVRVGTVMHRSHIPLQKWVIGIYLWATSLKSVSSMKLHRDLGITQKSAYFMAQRLREAWSDMPFDTEGLVEADGSYFGGARKNMPNWKQKAQTGRRTVGKTAVAGIKDRETGQVSARVTDSTKADDLQRLVRNHAVPGAPLCTDEAGVYNGMPEYEHEAVDHSASEYVQEMAHISGIESFWSLLKRGYHGTFHHISEKRLRRYVNEFATRHNLRPQDTIAMMQDTVARMVGKRLTYRGLITD